MVSKQQIIDLIVNKRPQDIVFPAVVKNVRGNTCTVLAWNELEIENVRLLADTDSKEGFTLTPRPNSLVMICAIDADISNAFIAMCSELDEATVKIGGAKVDISEDGVKIQHATPPLVPTNVSEIVVDNNGATISRNGVRMGMTNQGLTLGTELFGLEMAPEQLTLGNEAFGAVVSAEGVRLGSEDFGVSVSTDGVTLGHSEFGVSVSMQEVALKRLNSEIAITDGLVSIKNDQTSLKALLQEVLTLLKTMRVMTGTGPAVTDPSFIATDIVPVEAKINQLLK